MNEVQCIWISQKNELNFLFSSNYTFEPISNYFSEKANHLFDIWEKLGHHHEYGIS